LVDFAAAATATSEIALFSSKDENDWTALVELWTSMVVRMLHANCIVASATNVREGDAMLRPNKIKMYKMKQKVYISHG